MKFSRPDADVFVPASGPMTPDQALARTTHLCVVAHQDDIEIMAHAGIAECYGRADKHFTGVVVTSGAGSPRSGRFAAMTDVEMQKVRRDEQRQAAALGRSNPEAAEWQWRFFRETGIYATDLVLSRERVGWMQDLNLLLEVQRKALAYEQVVDTSVALDALKRLG